MPRPDPNITAEVLCDVQNLNARYTCMKVTMPRFILAEFNTHRQFTRSTTSSRAIPIAKQLEKVRTNPFIPNWFGKNQSGMKANEELEGPVLAHAEEEWIKASQDAIHHVEFLDYVGMHKQSAARILEPFLYCTTLVAATEWENFYALRCHKDAQPEFQRLAYRMLEAHVKSVPTMAVKGMMYGPYMKKMDRSLSMADQIKICVARCARTSYENFNGDIDYADDIRLHDSLLAAGHMSPFEFIVTPTDIKSPDSGNLKGFIQYRKTLPDECRVVTDRRQLLASKPDWI